MSRALCNQILLSIECFCFKRFDHVDSASLDDGGAVYFLYSNKVDIADSTFTSERILSLLDL